MRSEVADAVEPEHGNDATAEDGLHDLGLLVGVRGTRAGSGQTRVLAQDLALEPLQLGAGLDPELLDEAGAGVRVRVERLRLPAGAVEREHERLRSVSRSGCSSTRVSSSPMTSPCRPSSRSASIRSSSATSRSSSSRRISGCANASNVNSASAGPRQSSSARTSNSLRSPGRARGRRATALEPVRVDLLGRDAEHVAGRARLEDVRAELPAQARDRVLERGRRGSRRLPAPELVDEPVGRHDAAGLQDEKGHERPLPVTAKRDRAAVALDLERAQDAELQRHARLYFGAGTAVQAADDVSGTGAPPLEDGHGSEPRAAQDPLKARG